MPRIPQKTLSMYKAVEFKEIRKSDTVGALRAAIDAEHKSTLVFDRNYAQLLAKVLEHRAQISVSATAEDCAAIRDASALRAAIEKSASH
jgi:hypothetical protein